MKKIIALLLVFLLCFCGCEAPKNDVSENSQYGSAGNITSTTTNDEIIDLDQFYADQTADDYYNGDNNYSDYQYTESNNFTESSNPLISGTSSSFYPTNRPVVNYPTVDTPVTTPTTSTPSYTTGGSTAGTSSKPTTSTSTTTSKPSSTTTSKPSTTTSSKPTTSTTTSSKPTTSTTTPSTSTAVGTYLYVNYINVGQGDSTLIKIGDCDILIDGGKPGQGSTVSSFLKNKGVDDIELMINSHPDEDHYGGLTTVLNDFVVEQFWGSSYSKSTSSYTSFKSAISREGLSFKTPSVGTVYTYSNLSLTVLYNGSGASNSNDSSLVIMVKYGSHKFLFTGDISSTIESKLVSSGKSLSCNVLKVPHHGSAGSSSANFLKATGAKYGVICVGSNSYGHPTSAALTRLSSAGITVYRTDQKGNVIFATNGSSLTLPGGTIPSGGSTGSTSSSSSSSSSNTDTFIGNKESKVFHLPTCSYLPAASKRNYLYDYWFIINCIGYKPCGHCLKNYTP